MTQKQQPLGSGFTAASTTTDVLEGIDLSGRNVVVTGGHIGLGLETTRALAHAGASVTVGARNPDRAAAALEGIERVEIDQLDLLDPTSIDAFAARYRDSGRPLHILVNNAGIMGGPLVRDARGYEAQFATNHLGHFQLTNALLPALRAANGARVVELSSAGHRLSDIRWDDPHFNDDYDGMLAYGQAKTANVLFAVELDRRWAGDGIRGYSLHPGQIVGTSLAPWLGEGDLRSMGLVDDSGQPIIDPERDMKTPQQGASTSVFAATSPLLAEIGGVYLKDNDVAPLSASAMTVGDRFGSSPVDTSGGVMPYAVDPESAQRLWELSEELLRA
ncbi:SDR family NAD(P)-dependent oxidoreductase [Mycolicibacterium sp. P9-64]|uniref:SDR family NAD(P)-dependent oxidoreductase n=1 Tax=Mycolicibacterium sp. P9-64 TaxID=2024612 RepID=UPI0011EC0DD3|nr:SDR family NAD(P)-dependent oxidoreductase [Mycolicibacterium sp. P9-64]KAA0086952.1 SDR family NAD(P)-dependent oxidoreductase [Mycolicibacterium sp. P9-64]